MSDTSTDAAEEEVVETDEAREALLEAIGSEFGDAIVETHLLPGKDLWIRIDPAAWADTASYMRNRQRFRFFNWLSAIDWLPSPFGRSMDSEVDKLVGAVEDEGGEDEEAGSGYAGGATRFQVVARLHNLSTLQGVTFKTDVGDAEASNESLSVATWTHEFPGADWHEREAFEMYGIRFDGHPGLRKLYLPGDFEGNPLRKDFPLLARIVKPWPGIVDVEPMPELPAKEEPDGETSGESDGTSADATPASAGGPSTENPEA